jgi:hypothetical protein
LSLRVLEHPLFLTSGNEFCRLKQSLFRHPDMGVVVEAFVSQFTPLFNVPALVAEDLVHVGAIQQVVARDCYWQCSAVVVWL